MTWHYIQSTGELLRNGRHFSMGYSGSGSGRNNPAGRGAGGIGPIPVGEYAIGAAYEHPAWGPFTLPLEPQPSNLPGPAAADPAGLLIRGDARVVSQDAPSGVVSPEALSGVVSQDALSHGGLILPLVTRAHMLASGDRHLVVLAELVTLTG